MIKFVEKPKLFLGSSSDSIKVAKELEKLLETVSDCQIWTETFPLSENTLRTLENTISTVDFAVFILSDDDTASIRNKKFKISRDNVLFESGMAIASLGSNRTFLLAPITDPDFHLPSDLAGFTVAPYNKDLCENNPAKALEEAFKKISKGIDISLWSKLKLDISVYLLIDERATYKLKIWMEFKNHEDFAITLISDEFKLNGFDVIDGFSTGNKFKPKFFHFTSKSHDKTEDIRRGTLTLESGMQTNCFVPVNFNNGIEIIKDNFQKINCGEFSIRCLVHKENIVSFGYRLNIISEEIKCNSNINFQMKDLFGKWVNTWDINKNKEDLIINSKLKYSIGEPPRDAFYIQDFKPNGNYINFKKVSIQENLPSFENELIVVNRNILIGSEKNLESGKSHFIRYNRVD